MATQSRPLATLLAAIEFAAHKHRDQRRKGVEASPYINHPIQVASLIAGEGGVEDLPTLIAAVLHDTVEDTDTSLEELEAVFGRAVRDLVAEVTDDKSLEKAARKRLQIEHASQLSDAARLIKLADKICNVRDVGQAPPAHWSDERRLQYLDWAAEVVAGCRSASAPLAALFDKALAESRRPDWWSRGEDGAQAGPDFAPDRASQNEPVAVSSAAAGDQVPAGYASSPCYAHEFERPPASAEPSPETGLNVATPQASADESCADDASRRSRQPSRD